MNRKMILRAAFSSIVALVLTFGLATASSAAPGTGCPSTQCGDLSGWTHVGTCKTIFHDGCVEQCQIYRDHKGATCKSDCAFW